MAASSPATPSSSAPAGARTCPAVIRRRCTTRSLSGSRRCPTTRCSSPATTMAGHPPPSATRSARTRSCGSPRSATSSGPRAAAPASSSRRRRVISGRDVATLLTRHGFDFFTGVPCSLVEDVIAVLETERDASYVAAVREDAAVGLAAGAWLAGRRPCVLMQNSGLGTSLNALASLSLMYGFPALVVVTWRGYAGQDAPEHILTGRITPQILDLLGMPYRVLSAESAAADVAWAAKEMDTRMQPVAIVVPPRVVQTGGVHHDAAIPRPSGAGGPAKAPRRHIQRTVDSTADELAPSISGLAPRRLVHVVFDNEVYGSTGNQVSPSRGVRLDRVAAAAGYRTVAAVTAAAETEAAVRAALGADGPHFVLVKTTAEEADVPRIPYSPAEIRDRFRASLEV